VRFYTEYQNEKVISKGATSDDNIIIEQPLIEITEEEYNAIIFETQTVITAEQIDAQIVEKIRLRYNENDEMKMLRLGIVDSNDAEFLAYNSYVEECREWGRVEKLKLGGM